MATDCPLYGGKQAGCLLPCRQKQQSCCNSWDSVQLWSHHDRGVTCKHALAGKTNYFALPISEPESRAQLLCQDQPSARCLVKGGRVFPPIDRGHHSGPGATAAPVFTGGSLYPMQAVRLWSAILSRSWAQVAYPERYDYQLLLVNGEDTLHHDGRYFVLSC